MALIQTLYAWVMAAVDGSGDKSISLVTILLVLGIIALVVFIFGYWRHR